MRTFEVYIKNGKVVCDKDVMHMGPDAIENFAIFLRSGLEEDYKMDNLVITNDHENRLIPQRLNTSTIILHDNNMNKKKPGRPKFCVKLTPRGSNPKVKKLDPMVVNE